MAEKEPGKPLRERFVKTVMATMFGQNAVGKLDKIDESLLQEFMVVLMDKLSRSKDDIVTILGQEIGHALATVIKEPLDQLLAGKQLHVTLELKSAPQVMPDEPSTAVTPVPAPAPENDTAKKPRATRKKSAAPAGTSEK